MGFDNISSATQIANELADLKKLKELVQDGKIDSSEAQEITQNFDMIEGEAKTKLSEMVEAMFTSQEGFTALDKTSYDSFIKMVQKIDASKKFPSWEGIKEILNNNTNLWYSQLSFHGVIIHQDYIRVRYDEPGVNDTLDINLSDTGKIKDASWIETSLEDKDVENNMNINSDFFDSSITNLDLIKTAEIKLQQIEVDYIQNENNSLELQKLISNIDAIPNELKNNFTAFNTKVLNRISFVEDSIANQSDVTKAFKNKLEKLEEIFLQNQNNPIALKKIISHIDLIPNELKNDFTNFNTKVLDRISFLEDSIANQTDIAEAFENKLTRFQEIFSQNQNNPIELKKIISNIDTIPNELKDQFTAFNTEVLNRISLVDDSIANKTDVTKVFEDKLEKFEEIFSQNQNNPIELKKIISNIDTIPNELKNKFTAFNIKVQEKISVLENIKSSEVKLQQLEVGYTQNENNSLELQKLISNIDAIPNELKNNFTAFNTKVQEKISVLKENNNPQLKKAISWNKTEFTTEGIKCIQTALGFSQGDRLDGKIGPQTVGKIMKLQNGADGMIGLGVLKDLKLVDTHNNAVGNFTADMFQSGKLQRGNSRHIIFPTVTPVKKRVSTIEKTNHGEKVVEKKSSLGDIFQANKILSNFTGKDGKKIDITFDAKNNTLAIDTGFFDAISDSTMENNFLTSDAIKDIKSEAGAQKFVDQKLSEMKDFYDTSVFTTKIKNIENGNWKRTVIDTFIPSQGGKPLDIVLIRENESDRPGANLEKIYLKIDSPSNDKVSDYATQILITKYNTPLSEVDIKRKIEKIQTKYNHLYAKNNTK